MAWVAGVMFADVCCLYLYYEFCFCLRCVDLFVFMLLDLSLFCFINSVDMMVLC